MSNSPSTEDIVNALKKSGYLMEQEVATQLEALDFHVTTNVAFRDIEEGKSREIDVRAIKRIAHNEEKKLDAFIEIIAECKNSTNPFVFIGRPKNQMDNRLPPEEFVFPVPDYQVDRRDGNYYEKAFFYLGLDKVHPDFTEKTKTVQFCRIDRKGKDWHANHDGLYDSIFYPMAKALTARKSEISSRGTRPYEEWCNLWLFVPVVIVSGAILYVDSMESDPVPQARDVVTFKREIQSGKLSGIYAVTFVRQPYLEQFISGHLEPLIDEMAYLTTNRADFVLSRSILSDHRIRKVVRK